MCCSIIYDVIVNNKIMGFKIQKRFIFTVGAWGFGSVIFESNLKLK